MRKQFFLLPVFCLLTAAACNNNNENSAAADPLKTKADSLEKEVEDGHNIAMPRSMKLPDIQKEAQRLIDSLDKLPSKVKESAAPYRARLDSLVKDLEYAAYSMDKWMSEYKYDSAVGNLEQRIRYLADEKLKVDKVKQSVLGSIEKADSLLHRKF